MPKPSEEMITSAPGVTGLATSLSRLFEFVRDVVIAPMFTAAIAVAVLPVLSTQADHGDL